MPQTINTNVMSLTAQRNLNTSQGTLATAMQRLSSGLRVNSAKDDAAGLAIAERMNTQVRGMNVATNLDAEFQALDSEITRIADTTKFNGETVLNNNGSSVVFQVGANNGADNTLSIALVAISATGESIAGVSAARSAMSAIDAKITDITSSRADFGAMQSRFESAINNLQVGMENQSAARGRIMDADFAVETSNMTRSQILQQAGNAMISQANSAPQSVLQLLG